MKIEVTQKDIEKGKRNSSRFCPVARAVRRATRKRYIEVTGRTIFIERKELFVPLKVTRFINRFDDSILVHPFSFELPDEAFSK